MKVRSRNYQDDFAYILLMESTGREVLEGEKWVCRLSSAELQLIMTGHPQRLMRSSIK